MGTRLRTGILCGFVLVLTSRAALGQTSGKTFNWTGEVSSDAANAANWVELPTDTGAVPGPQDFVEFRQGDRPPVDVDYGSADVAYEHILFNHASDGTTINGTGTIALTQSGGPQSVNVKSMETQSGPRLSKVNASVVALGMLEARNGHDIEFNGNATFTTVHAYLNDDQIDSSDVVFNGHFTHTGFGEAKFMTGTGTVRFNNEVTLDHQAGSSGFGIRNGMTAILGPNFFADRLLPGGGGGPGFDTVDMYNNSGFRLEGDNLIGNDTDLFSRFGDGQINTNKLDLNGHSDHVEFLGTHPGATFVIDFGNTPGPNSFEWETTHHHVGTYQIVNFEIGVDRLTLGGAGSTWWTAADTETDGGGSPDSEVDKSHMTINGVPYGAYNPSRTTPYWTLVDPDLSRDVQIFNFVESDADFDGNDIVDGKDFLIWQRGLGKTGQTSNANGDANGDGTVNETDFAVWRTAYGTMGAASLIGAAPEPASAILAALAMTGAVRLRRRKAA